jgi:DNA-binding NarL/FixJ family response regulator
MQTAVGQPIRILIIDDQSVVNASVRFLPERRPSPQVVGEVPKAFDAFTAARDDSPTSSCSTSISAMPAVSTCCRSY